MTFRIPIKRNNSETFWESICHDGKKNPQYFQKLDLKKYNLEMWSWTPLLSVMFFRLKETSRQKLSLEEEASQEIGQDMTTLPGRN